MTLTFCDGDAELPGAGLCPLAVSSAEINPLSGKRNCFTSSFDSLGRFFVRRFLNQFGIKPSAMKAPWLIIFSAVASTAFAQPDDDALWQKLDAQVNATVKKFDGTMGVAIVDLTDGRAILKNADRVFPTASSIKIAVLLELYHQEQQAREGAQGKARLNDVYDFDPKVLVDFSSIMQGLTPGLTKVTNHDLAQFMIAVSDNTASNILIERLGMENVNSTLRSLGLTKTLLRRHMMDFEAAKRGNENVSTPREIDRKSTRLNSSHVSES